MQWFVGCSLLFIGVTMVCGWVWAAGRPSDRWGTETVNSWFDDIMYAEFEEKR
jgi:hypothetical protein